ncbi:hypothetical protein MA16_Dca025764 [Dendrobium catenatum]|uniref:Uncharacterized protein n=1 Tax=Dendrobium catenatum TaxID=906689 RepID=A0A2I0VL55_9ASPA|nr:hypothetical protein MA16_Dca025764 [Dendrobium catenatum]
MTPPAWRFLLSRLFLRQPLFPSRTNSLPWRRLTFLQIPKLSQPPTLTPQPREMPLLPPPLPWAPISLGMTLPKSKNPPPQTSPQSKGKHSPKPRIRQKALSFNVLFFLC